MTSRVGIVGSWPTTIGLSHAARWGHVRSLGEVSWLGHRRDMATKSKEVSSKCDIHFYCPASHNGFHFFMVFYWTCSLGVTPMSQFFRVTKTPRPMTTSHGRARIARGCGNKIQHVVQ